jgi:hypothetical protein
VSLERFGRQHRSLALGELGVRGGTRPELPAHDDRVHAAAAHVFGERAQRFRGVAACLRPCG